jgi:hypothetical protein
VGLGCCGLGPVDAHGLGPGNSGLAGAPAKQAEKKPETASYAELDEPISGPSNSIVVAPVGLVEKRLLGSRREGEKKAATNSNCALLRIVRGAWSSATNSTAPRTAFTD